LLYIIIKYFIVYIDLRCFHR